MGRFNFTGKLRVNTADAKYPSFRSGKSKNGNEYKSATLFINPAENNSGVTELFGAKQDPIKTMDTDGNKIDVAWDEREDADVVKNVANYRKNVIVCDDDRNEFVSSYDAVEFLENNVDELKGKIVTVTGRSVKNIYNGEISERYQIQNLYVAAEDKLASKKQALNINEICYFNKDSFDLSEFKSESKIYVNAYTKEYIDKDNQDVFVAKQYIIDASKVDFNDPQMVKIFNVRFRPLGLAYKDEKVSCGLKAGKYYHMAINVKMMNGSPESDFDESMLTPAQREMVELHIKELEDFRPKGSIYGSRVLQYKIYACDISGDEYSEGKPVEYEGKASEFEDNIYTASKPEKKDEELDMNEPTSDSDEGDDDSLDDLFS